MSRTLLLLVSGCAVALTGCSTISHTYKYVANKTAGQMIEQVLNSDDIEAACTNVAATQPLLGVNNLSGNSIKDAAILNNALSGWCAEREAYHANIRSNIANRNNIPEAAVFEHDQEKYWYYVAGQRQLKAYNTLSKWAKHRYLPVSKTNLTPKTNAAGVVCPALTTKDEQVVYFVGLMAGTQAVANNLRSGMRLPIAQNTLSNIQDQLTCINDEQVWNGASALSNSLKVIKADEKDQAQIYKDMRQQIINSKNSPVQLPLALYTYTAWAMGDQDQIDNSLLMYNNTLTNPLSSVSPYRLLNAVAVDMVTNIYEMDHLNLASTISTKEMPKSNKKSTARR